MKYFISGHRDLTIHEFRKYYAKKISNVVMGDPKAHFVVGDYHGADEMAHGFLYTLKLNYPEITVTVYHMGKRPMHNLYNFATSADYADDHHRDSAMTINSDEDIAWAREGKEYSGTAQNIIRRKVKNVLVTLPSEDAINFLQGILNTMLCHPENEFDEPPIVYYP